MENVLPLLIHAAESARDRHASTALQARRTADDAQATLARLRDFRSDCLARGATASLAEPRPATLADYQRFVGRLDQAIDLQQRRWKTCEGQAEILQRQLSQFQRRVLAFETLRTRASQARETRERRGDQRLADEHAARASRVRSR